MIVLDTQNEILRGKKDIERKLFGGMGGKQIGGKRVIRGVRRK